MEDRTRLTGWAGIIAVIFIIVSGLISGQPPTPDDPPAEIREYLVDNRSGILAATALQFFGAVFFVTFLMGARDVVRRARDGQLLGTALVVGGVMTLLIALVGQALFAGAVWVDGFAETLGDDLTTYAYSAQTLVFASSVATFFLFAAALGIAVLRDRVLPVAVAWLSLLVLVASVAGVAAPFDPALALIGFVAFLSSMLLILVTSIMMATGRAREASPA